MGLCMSAEDAENKKRNDEIDMQLKKEKADLKNEIKMLLLGAGESGASSCMTETELRLNLRCIRQIHHSQALVSPNGPHYR